MLTVKKLKPTSEKFRKFECICGTKEVEFTLLPAQLQCILRNYKIYLQSRNVWNSYNSEYREVINRNIQFPDKSITNVCLTTDVDFSNTNHLKHGNFRLCGTVKPMHTNTLERMVDTICADELSKFINMHVYNRDMSELIASELKVYNEMKKSNF